MGAHALSLSLSPRTLAAAVLAAALVVPVTALADVYSLGSTDLRMQSAEGCFATSIDVDLSGSEQLKIATLAMVVADTDGDTDLYWYVLQWQTSSSDWDVIWDGCPSACAAPNTMSGPDTASIPSVGVTWGPSHYPDGEYAIVFCWANDTDIKVFGASPFGSGSAEDLISGKFDSDEDLWHPLPTGSPPLGSTIDFDDDGYIDPPWTVTLDEDLDADGYTDLTGGDCDDSDATVNPGASELCDGLDTDCSSGTPTTEKDDDGDGYVECTPWVGSVAGITGGGDCNDAASTVHPAATEVCDAIDNDCDGIFDGTTDSDSDNWGTGLSGGCKTEDCDDSDSGVFPWVDLGASDDYEAWYGTFVDEDCDGLNCQADWAAGDDVYLALCAGDDVSNYGSSWSDAQGFCEDSPAGYGGLGAVLDATEGSFVDALRTGAASASSFGIVDWWLAGTDAASEGTFAWDDGYSSAWSYTDWASGNPTGTSTDWDCVVEDWHTSGSQWSDAPCGTNSHFVCALR
jgi:hypothetical protein